MRAVAEVVLAVLAVLGLLTLGWLVRGFLLSPPGGKRTWAVIPGSGDGETLEQAVKGLCWLRDGGLWKGPVVIADCGLNAAGRTVADALTRQRPDVELCAAGKLDSAMSARCRRTQESGDGI